MTDFALTLEDVKMKVADDSYAYILERTKLKDKPKQKIMFFQLLRCVDAYEAAILLLDKFPVTSTLIIESYINLVGNVYCDVGTGFDCWLPYNEQRDYRIKQWMKFEQAGHYGKIG